MKLNLLYSIFTVILNMIIPIIIFPYASRVLGTEGLGTYNFYASAQSYLLLLTSFGVGIYGVRQVGAIKDNKFELKRCFNQLISINLFLVIISYVIVLLLMLWANLTNDIYIIGVFSVTLLTNAFGADWVFVGLEKQKYLLIRNLIIKIFSLIAILLFVKKETDLLLFVTIMASSIAILSLSNMYCLRQYYSFRLISIQGSIVHLRRMYNVFFMEILIRYLGLGDVIILGFFVTRSDIGVYSMALKIFLIITSLLKITATTLLPRASYYVEHCDRRSFIEMHIKTINFLIIVSFFCSFILFFYAKDIIMIVGGEQFIESVRLLKGFALVVFIAILNNTLCFQILYPLNKTRSVLLVNLFAVFVNVCMNVILIPRIGYLSALISFVASLIITLVLILCLERKEIKPILLKVNIKKCFYSMIVLYIVYIVIYNMNYKIPVLLELCVLSIIYGGVLLIFKEDITTSIFKLIKKQFK